SSPTIGSSSGEALRPTETPNNRFAAGQGYVYDAVGNTIADANGQTYIYDAENKMVTASNAGGTFGQYAYDGAAPERGHSCPHRRCVRRAWISRTVVA